MEEGEEEFWGFEKQEKETERHARYMYPKHSVFDKKTLCFHIFVFHCSYYSPPPMGDGWSGQNFSHKGILSCFAFP